MAMRQLSVWYPGTKSNDDSNENDSSQRRSSRCPTRAIESTFPQKLGREPGPDDPLVFDQDAETPQRMSQEKHQQQLAEKLN
jgi:hypothetical protein